MKKVIVTGATGFIGSNIVFELVKNNFEVGILCRENSNLNILEPVKDRVSIFKTGDNLDEIIKCFKSFEPDCIFHLASLFIAEHKKADVRNLIDSNVKYPTIILEAMKECGIKNLINTGTAWQHYENKDYNPVCLYAATKESFEKIIEFYVNALSFKCITLKIFDSYGENDHRGKLISVLKDKAISNEKLSMSEGNQKIDLTHIKDITNGFIKAYEYLDSINYGEHRKYALCTERQLTLKEVLNIFQDKTGYKLNVEWGAREYRKREVMDPWTNYEILPNWVSTISFEEGVESLVK